MAQYCLLFISLVIPRPSLFGIQWPINFTKQNWGFWKFNKKKLQVWIGISILVIPDNMTIGGIWQVIDRVIFSDIAIINRCYFTIKKGWRRTNNIMLFLWKILGWHFNIWKNQLRNLWGQTPEAKSCLDHSMEETTG